MNEEEEGVYLFVEVHHSFLVLDDFRVGGRFECFLAMRKKFLKNAG